MEGLAKKLAMAKIPREKMRFMGPLGRVAARTTAAALGAIVALGLSGALVRMLPWFLDSRISTKTAMVFARGLAASAIEASGMIALPIGLALAAALFSDRGEARACFLSGASPLSLARSTWPIAALVGLAIGGASALVAADATAPSSVLTELVRAAKSGCDSRSRPVAEIPGTPAAWLCEPGDSPMLATAIGTSTLVRARELTLSSDLREATLRDASFDFRGPPLAHLEVAEAHLSGITAIAVPSGISALPRALATSLGTIVSSLSLLTWLLSRRIDRRVVALLAGGATGIAMLLGVRLLERAHGGILGALALTILGSLPLLLSARSLPAPTPGGTAS